MTTLTLTDPTNGTTADANTIASNNTAIKAVVNGSIDNTNIAASAAIAASKISGGVTNIFDSTLGGTQASFDITSIAATYAALLVVGFARGNDAADQAVLLRFNNDSAANYDYESVQGQTTTATVAENLAQTGLGIGLIPGTGATANYFGAFFALIPNYAGTTGNKLALAMAIDKSANTTGTITLRSLGGGWRTTASAVNRLTLLPAAGSFIAGSRCTLYGLG